MSFVDASVVSVKKPINLDQNLSYSFVANQKATRSTQSNQIALVKIGTNKQAEWTPIKIGNTSNNDKVASNEKVVDSTNVVSIAGAKASNASNNAKSVFTHGDLQSEGQAYRATAGVLNSLKALVPAKVGVFSYLSASVVPNSAVVSWSLAPNVSFYLTKYGTTSGNYTLQSTGNSPLTLPSLTPGTTYYIKTTASNSVSSYSTQELMIKPIASFTASVSNNNLPNSLTVSWSSPAGADNYSVIYGTSSGDYPLTANCVASPCVISGLTAGAVYYFQVLATNSVGFGASQYANAEVTGIPLGLFSITSISSIGQTSTTGSVSLAWNNSTGSSSYNLKYGTTSGVYTSSLLGVSSPLTVSNLSAETRYYFVVQSVSSSGTLNSNESNIVPYQVFNSNFNFSSSLQYNKTSGVQISLNQASLLQSNTITEKTNDGTGNSSYNVFDNYDQKSANVSVTNDMVTLSSGSSGQYTSQAMDGMNNVVPWSGFSFNGSLPFFKELANSQETGYTATPTNFSQNLILLYHFNESSLGTSPGGRDFFDSSNSGDHGKLYRSTATLGAGGLFANAVNFTGAFATGKVPYVSTGLRTFTQSVWFNTTATSNQGKLIGLESSSSSALGTNYDRHIYMIQSGKLVFGVWPNSEQTITSPLSYNDGKWHHVVSTMSLTAGMNLYVDGVLVGSNPNTGVQTNYTGWWHIGGGSNYWSTATGSLTFNGKIDEVAVWNNTALTQEQVRELYRRGSNRIKMQIRTCSDISGNTCSGTITPWVGPDGTPGTFFSDLNNNTDPVKFLGTVNLNSFNVPWNLFTSGFSSWSNTSSNNLNRYIQYQMTLESDTGLFFPNLSSASFTPSTRFPVSGIVYNINSISIPYVLIDTVQITDSCPSGARYEFTPDGSNYYYWNGISWILNTFGNTKANSSATINSIDHSGWNSFSNNGNFGFRAYLNSDGLASCSISSVSVTGQK